MHNDIQHNGSVVMLRVICVDFRKQSFYTECHCAECYYAERRGVLMTSIKKFMLLVFAEVNK